MIVFLLTACSLLDSAPDTPVVDPGKLQLKTPPPATVPSTKPVAAKSSLTCDKPERTRLECKLSNGKRVALCETADGLSFRYGHPAVELAFPATGHGKDFKVTRTTKGEDAEVFTTSFKLKDYRYVVTSERTEDQFEVVFEVYKGKQRLQQSQCTEMGGIDFTEFIEAWGSR